MGRREDAGAPTEPDRDTQATVPDRRPGPRHGTRPDKIGRYVVLRPLGEGGMAAVVLAYDSKLKRNIALKLLHPGPGGSSGAPELRLQREAEAMAQLTHPNVVTVHDTGTAGDDCYIAMEFVEGQTLRDWLRSDDRDPHEVIEVMLQAGHGLAAAHRAKLVHRDFKPSNVLIDQDGRARVSDFGLVRDADTTEESGATPASESRQLQLTRTGNAVGTPAYMAPEQHRGETADELSDQFSYCLTFYQALYGENPLNLSSRRALRRSVEEPIRPPPKGNGVPGWPWELLERGLALDPARRWPDMDSLLRNLEHRRDRHRRRPFGIAVAGFATVAAIAAGAVVGLRTDSSGANPCARADEATQQTWNDDTRARLRQTFERTSAELARTTLPLVNHYLDRYQRSWSRKRFEVCEATSVHHVQSSEMLDLRMDCLDRQHGEFSKVIEVLEGADSPAVLARAAAAATTLPALQECDDREHLRAVVRPPRDERSQRTLLAGRERIESARALLGVGQYADCLSTLDRAMPDLLELDHAPILARSEETRARCLQELGHYDQAADAAEKAVIHAGAARDDFLLVRALLTLLNARGLGQARLDLALLGVKPMLEASLARLGDETMRAKYLASLTAVHLAGGDVAQAQALLPQALSLLEATHGPSQQLAAGYLVAGAIARHQGNLTKAREFFEKSEKLFREKLGPSHPRIGAPLSNLGDVAQLAGDLDAAEQFYGRAAEFWDRTGNLALLGVTYNNLSVLSLARDDADGAHRRAKRALSYLERASMHTHRHAGIAWENLARADATQGNYADAIDSYRRAVAIFARSDLRRTRSDLNELRAVARHGRVERQATAAIRSLVRDWKTNGENNPDGIELLKEWLTSMSSTR